MEIWIKTINNMSKCAKISQTAIPIARIRADYTNIPYSKEIIRHLRMVGEKHFLYDMIQSLAYYVPSIRKRFSG